VICKQQRTVETALLLLVQGGGQKIVNKLKYLWRAPEREEEIRQIVRGLPTSLACHVYVPARRNRIPRGPLKQSFRLGYCPICASQTVFVKHGNWLRESLLCIRCGSNPRWRAVIATLEEHFPDWREMTIHESSPGGSASDKLRDECKRYIPAYYFPDTPLGSYKDGVQCENLEHMSFGDSEFDLVVTQDVMEHVFHPAVAFAEIARVLKPGGAHVFTVPWYRQRMTITRATDSPNGIIHLAAPEYHGNPVDESGSLVVTAWGLDICDRIMDYSGMITTVIPTCGDRNGVPATGCEIFISRKPSTSC
jgi:hypothetical protein